MVVMATLVAAALAYPGYGGHGSDNFGGGSFDGHEVTVTKATIATVTEDMAVSTTTTITVMGALGMTTTATGTMGMIATVMGATVMGATDTIATVTKALVVTTIMMVNMDIIIKLCCVWKMI
ncbi:uncharacterized protein LOC125234917 isoform X2 [Leguminivora glycinivorella]|uniref:uncharacterized protein LOC125234917 isoform X2 n=1 Tax=Leguminivora glycinivorella TaxID=1035111 RepID=UPI00200FC697|nr:uncharacterized protein LOC125234917 isoform X2 [Leguminivora glycinivorella]